MSHFVGLCFGECWEYNLEQYYEGLEVEEYVVYSKEQAIYEVQDYHQRSYESAVRALQDPNIEENSKKYYESVIAKGPSISDEDAWKEAKEWGYKVDNKDQLLSTYNPDSKWDWYSLGGRWNNWLVVKEKDENGERIRVNQANISEIDWDYMFEKNMIPFCFVTESGEWCETAEMGWWCATSNEKNENDWKNEFLEYLKCVDNYCLVTVVDFHI